MYFPPHFPVSKKTLLGQCHEIFYFFLGRTLKLNTFAKNIDFFYSLFITGQGRRFKAQNRDRESRDTVPLQSSDVISLSILSVEVDRVGRYNMQLPVHCPKSNKKFPRYTGTVIRNVEESEILHELSRVPYSISFSPLHFVL